jgi:hypothetical protein
MIRQAPIPGLIALEAGACTTEHRTAVVAFGDVCTRYGFTASTGDYVHRQRRIAGQATCASYGIPRGAANFDQCVQDNFAARRPG